MRTARSTRDANLRRRSSRLTALSLSIMLAGCNALLEVDLPGVVKAEDRNNPVLATVLINGVIGDFECAWSNYTTAGGLLTEWVNGLTNSGVGQGGWMQRDIPQGDQTIGIGNCLQFYGLYTPLHAARWQSESAYDLFAGFDQAAVPNKVELQGITRAYGGYALLALGEGFCSMAIEGGPEMTRTQVFTLAETKFTEATTLLQSLTTPTATSVLNMARVGRARIRGDLKNWAGALADAALIPRGFSRMALREDVSFERSNKYVRLQNELSARNGSVADDYRDLRILADGTPTSYCNGPPCDGPAGAPFAPGEVADPRVQINNTGLLNRNNTPFIMHRKYTTYNDDIPLASYEEAQLYVAEAQAQLGNLQAAITAINGLRGAPLNLPLYATPTTMTQTQVIKAVLEERRRLLFQAVNARWNDLLRYDGTPNAMPWKGEPGSIHPTGRNAAGQLYGNVKCVLLPTVEIIGNPNID